MKLIGILQKHGLKCTFNLNSGAYSPEGTVFKPGTIHLQDVKINGNTDI